MKRKVWDITVKDNPNRVVMGENDEFYTTDTEAYLVFNLEDKNFNPATAVLTLENRNDGSLKNETVDVVDGLIEWEMPQRYIEHFGNWQGQLVYEDTKDGQPELYTSAPFSFVVNAHIGDKKKPSLVEIENWEKFIRDGTELIETWEDMEDLRQANEAQRQANYQELLDTGVLQTNINQKLAEAEQEYAPRLTELEQNDANLTAQLAQKVGGGNKAELEDLSSTVLSAIEGGEGTEFNLLSIPQYRSVSHDKTTFMTTGKNLFDPKKATKGYRIHTENGGLVENEVYYVSDFIPVNAGQTYTVSHHYYRGFYDGSKNFVSGHNMEGLPTFTVPEGAKYVRVSVYEPFIDRYQLEIGNVATEVEPFYYEIEGLKANILGGGEVLNPVGETREIFHRYGALTTDEGEVFVYDNTDDPATLDILEFATNSLEDVTFRIYHGSTRLALMRNDGIVADEFNAFRMIHSPSRMIDILEYDTSNNLYKFGFNLKHFPHGLRISIWNRSSDGTDKRAGVYGIVRSY